MSRYKIGLKHTQKTTKFPDVIVVVGLQNQLQLPRLVQGTYLIIH
jgi:hypothetical protein